MINVLEMMGTGIKVFITITYVVFAFYMFTLSGRRANGVARSLGWMGLAMVIYQLVGILQRMWKFPTTLDSMALFVLSHFAVALSAILIAVAVFRDNRGTGDTRK